MVNWFNVTTPKNTTLKKYFESNQIMLEWITVLYFYVQFFWRGKPLQICSHPPVLTQLSPSPSRLWPPHKSRGRRSPSVSAHAQEQFCIPDYHSYFSLSCKLGRLVERQIKAGVNYISWLETKHDKGWTLTWFGGFAQVSDHFNGNLTNAQRPHGHDHIKWPCCSWQEEGKSPCITSQL